eukprot:1923105-Rhodomonas_salina.2
MAKRDRRARGGVGSIRSEHSGVEPGTGGAGPSSADCKTSSTSCPPAESVRESGRGNSRSTGGRTRRAARKQPCLQTLGTPQL